MLASQKDVARKGLLMLGSGFAYGVVLIALGGVPWALMAFPIIALAGACQTVFRTANNTALLQVTPPQLRGRIFSMTLLDTGTAPLAAVLAGVITDVVSVSVAIGILGAICMVIVAGVALVEPRLRSV